METLVLAADIVLPVSSGPIRDGAVVVEGGKIADVGTSADIGTAWPHIRKVRIPDSIMLPGFVNAHTHLELCWTKGKIRGFDNFTGWLERLIRLRTDGVDPDFAEDAIREGAREVVRSGVTTIGEIAYAGSDGRWFLKDSGARIVAFVEISDSRLPVLSEFEFEKEDFYEERPFPHAPYSCAPQLLEAVFNRARTEGLDVGIHLGESPDEALFLRGLPNGFERKIFPLVRKKTFARPAAPTPVRYIDRFLEDGAPRLSAVHMVQTEPEDAEIIRKTGMGIILCPRSNVFLNVGKPDVRLLSDCGRVGLGTDGLSSNSDLDFFREMRFLHEIMVEQGMGRSARRTVRCATLGGAEALFIEDRTGSLEVGKSADIICLGRKGEPGSDPYLSVVSSGPENLHFSMAGGNFICGEDPRAGRSPG